MDKRVLRYEALELAVNVLVAISILGGCGCVFLGFMALSDPGTIEGGITRIVVGILVALAGMVLKGFTRLAVNLAYYRHGRPAPANVTLYEPREV
jgi:glycerol uptake facilitator-like aquaporin